MTENDNPPAKPTRCKICNGKGYLRCDCWPGDCICGFGDETCEECGGEGLIFPDDDYYPDDYYPDGYFLDEHHE